MPISSEITGKTVKHTHVNSENIRDISETVWDRIRASIFYTYELSTDTEIGDLEWYRTAYDRILSYLTESGIFRRGQLHQSDWS